MITDITIYRKDTGEIVNYFSFSCDDGNDYLTAYNVKAQLDFLGSDEHSWLPVYSDMLTEYVVVGDYGAKVVPRPPLRLKINKLSLIADGEDSITIRGLPSPCEMVQDPGEPEEASVVIEGGGFVFTAETPGLYQFRIEKFPFLPLDLEFTAT